MADTNSNTSKTKEAQEKNYTVKDLKDGKYELEITIKADTFKKAYDAVLKDTAATIDLKGFRKGKVPVEVIENQMKGTILVETFQKIAPTYSWYAVVTEKLNPMIPVDYKNLPKLDLGKDITYTIIIVTAPEFKLCDIKKIKVTKKSEEVTDVELKETLDEMFKNQQTKEKEMNDKWALEVAGKYGLKGVKDLAKLKEELKKVIGNQKTVIVQREFEKEILHEGIKLSGVKVPDEAVHYEAHQKEHSFMHQLEDAKIKLDDYLKQYNAKLEDLQKAWHEDSKEALEEHLFLNKYVEEKGIKADETEFQKFVEQVKGGQQVEYNQEWLESLRGLFLKQKGFEAFIKEVSDNLGIKPEQKKKDLILS